MDQKQLLKQRFDFYNEIKDKVELSLGKSSRQLEGYKRVYNAEIALMKPQRATHLLFFQSIQKADILLFGDFHSEPQSIRSLLRICRKFKSEDIILGLECVQAKHQNWLDRFVLGNISETEFLHKTDWGKNWDFPFDFVKPLFHWATVNRVKICGINESNSKLSIRDHKIAKNICAIKKSNPDKLLIVQIGDYHLAKKHLPANLKKIESQLRIQTVFQSPDEVYFKWMQKKKSVSDFLKMSEGRWAVMAVLPWVKWQNYLLWLETSSTLVENSESVDMTDHIARFVQFLSDTVKLQVDMSELSIYDMNEIDPSSEFKALESSVKVKIKNNMLDQKSFFVPELQKGYIQSYSLNHISKLAAEYFLFKNKVYNKTLTDPKKFFTSQVWLEMLTYFFTKIVNPKRKANTFFDMRTFMMTENFSDHGKDVLSIALQQKLKEMNSLGGTSSSLRRRKDTDLKKSKSYAAAARLLGGIMGEKVFWAYSHKRFRFPEAVSFLFQDLYVKSFQVKYYDLIEVIEQWPTVSKSKFDQF